MEAKLVKEFDAGLYNDRYKYGYNWGCYMELAKQIIDLALKTGAKDKKTIDVGCGVGWFTDFWYFNVSRNIKGIDFSEKAIDFHGRRMFPAVDMEIANIYNYDYNKYEAGILMEVLEHIDKDIDLINRFPTNMKMYCTIPFEKMRLDFSHVREYDLNSTRERYQDSIDIQYLEKFESYIILHGIKK